MSRLAPVFYSPVICLSVHLSVFLFISLCISVGLSSVFVRFTICLLFITLYISISRSVRLSVCLFHDLSFCSSLCTCRSVRLSVCPSVNLHLFVCHLVSLCPSASLSVSLSVYQSFSRSVFWFCGPSVCLLVMLHLHW